MQLFAQSKVVNFQFEASTTSGITNASGVERNISNLLSAINAACISGRSISFTGIRIDSIAQKNLELLWKNVHFYCEEDEIFSKCLHDWQGIQVRDIYIALKPLSEYEGSLERELSVSLNKGGVITGVRIALSNNQYKDVMKDGIGVTETRERMEIMKYIEDLRGYYLAKNIDALRKFYSEDAIIIYEGNSVNKKFHIAKPSNNNVCTKYGQDNYEQFIGRLSSLFNRIRIVEVEFDSISIIRHHSKPQYYGVTLHQIMKTNGKVDINYKDEGWLFMLWDFTDETHPVIHVRTWQPNEAAEQDGVFELSDFFL